MKSTATLLFAWALSATLTDPASAQSLLAPAPAVHTLDVGTVVQTLPSGAVFGILDASPGTSPRAGGAALTETALVGRAAAICTDPTDINTCSAPTLTAVLALPGESLVVRYTIENTGSVVLNRHTLTDTEEGVLLNDFPFTLNPGASAFLNVFSDAPEPSDLQPRLATWSANDMGANSATAEDDYVVVVGDIYGDFPGAPIPDNAPAGLSSSVTATNDGAITQVGINASITHSWVGDLAITLRHEDTGTEVRLMDRPGVPASTFGCSGDNFAQIVADDSHNGDLETECTNTTPAYVFRSYEPSNPLAAFVGEDAAGTWTLNVSDNAGGDTGTLGFWELIIARGPGVANEPVASGDMPGGYLLSQPVPNPFGRSSVVGFAVARAQEVTLDLYDTLGRRVRELHRGMAPANLRQEVRIDAAGLTPGAYVVRLTGETFRASRRVSLVR